MYLYLSICVSSLSLSFSCCSCASPSWLRICPTILSLFMVLHIILFSYTWFSTSSLVTQFIQQTSASILQDYMSNASTSCFFSLSTILILYLYNTTILTMICKFLWPFLLLSLCLDTLFYVCLYITFDLRTLPHVWTAFYFGAVFLSKQNFMYACDFSSSYKITKNIFFKHKLKYN